MIVMIVALVAIIVLVGCLAIITDTLLIMARWV